MKNFNLSRRAVLRGAGVALGLPMLEAMLPIGRAACIVPASEDRTIFALPWYGRVLAGTTDRDYEGDLVHVQPSGDDIDYLLDAIEWKRANPEGLARALSGGLIGSPETLRHKLRRFENSHIDQVILLNQAGKNTHEHICESLELFAREVMPEFHAHEPAQQAWKRQVLAREIELEEIDTEAFKDRYGKLAVTVARPAAAAAG